VSQYPPNFCIQLISNDNNDSDNEVKIYTERYHQMRSTALNVVMWNGRKEEQFNFF